MFFKEFIEVRKIGELQLGGDLRSCFVAVQKFTGCIGHRKGHAVVEQAFTGIFFHDPAQIGTIIIEKRGQLGVGDPPAPLAQYPVDTRKEQRFYVALRGDVFAAVQLWISEDTDQAGEQLQQPKARAVTGSNQRMQQILKDLVNQSDLLRLIDPRHKIQKILGVPVRILKILLEKIKNQVAVQLLFSRKEQGLSLIHQLADEVRADRKENTGIVGG